MYRTIFQTSCHWALFMSRISQFIIYTHNRIHKAHLSRMERILARFARELGAEEFKEDWWKIADRCDYLISSIISCSVHFSRHYRDAAGLRDFAMDNAASDVRRRFIESSTVPTSFFSLSLASSFLLARCPSVRPLEKWFHSRSESHLSFASIAIGNRGREHPSRYPSAGVC